MQGQTRISRMEKSLKKMKSQKENLGLKKMKTIVEEPKKKVKLNARKSENLKSVKDKNVKISPEDVMTVAEKVMEKYPTGINMENLIESTMIIMNLVEKLNFLNAEEKKDFICDVLCFVVDNTDAGSLEFLDPIIKKLIPKVIDNILEAKNEKLEIKKPKWCGCFK
jgi:hypothetical protein